MSTELPQKGVNEATNNRIGVNQDLRLNPEKFLITLDHLPSPTLTLPQEKSELLHTFHSIIERERNSLHIPASRHSMNVAQFIAMVSTVVEGIDLKQPSIELVNHFNNFQRLFRQTQELSLIAFDMDNLTSTNKQYTHLHGSLVCSMLEKTILETIEPVGGLLSSMGEENIVSLPYSLEDSFLAANIILQRFSSISFDFGAGEFHQGVSIGVASIKQSDPKTFRRLMELSGGALVYSKKHGKGIVTVFGDK